MIRKSITLIALLSLLGICRMPLIAQDKSADDMQKELQALNTLRSEESINKKLKEIAEDKKYAKALVKAGAALLPKKEENTFTYSSAHILGMAALEVRENKTAIEFLLIAIDKANKVKSVRKLSNNRVYLMEAYLADNRPAEAEKIARKIIATQINADDEEDLNVLATTRFYAELDLVRAVMQQGKFEDAQKLMDNLQKKADADAFTGPAKNLIYGTKAQFLTYKGDLGDAIKVYERMIEDSDNDERKDRYREVIGNLYADSGNVDKAYDILSEILKKKPDQAGLNNDLGYILASHDRKLDEAEKMIKKAVEAEPENPSFLDSMAWVLFKQKKYKEAKEYMLKAITHERGRNTELMEHLGDIQMALNEKDEAKKSYEAALAAVTFNYKDQARKPEIEKKLKELTK